MATTGTVALSGEVQKLYDGDYYISGQSQVCWDQLANLRMMMDGQKGQTYESVTIESLQPTPTALDELSDVATQSMRANPYDITLFEYGNAVKLTKYVTAVSYSDPLKQAAEVNGYSFAETVDTIVRATAGQGSRFIRQNGRTARASFATATAADHITLAFLERAVQIFARTIGMPLYPDGAVCAVMHPFVSYDMGQTSDIRTMGTRLVPELLFNAEWLYWSGCRLIISRNAKAFWGAGAAGSPAVATTLSTALNVGDSTMFVGSTANIAVGSWINIVDATESGNTWTDTNEIAMVTRVGTAGASGVGTGVDFYCVPGGPGNATYGPGGVRYAHSTISAAITNNAAVYPTVLVGPNSITKIASDLTGPWGETMVTGPFDILGRFVNVGWYGLLGYGRTREDFLFRMECGAAEL